MSACKLVNETSRLVLVTSFGAGSIRSSHFIPLDMQPIGQHMNGCSWRGVQCVGLTWRPQLGLAGRAGQRQTLTQPVHPVEADGEIRLRHGLQVLGRSERHPVGLVGESRLCRAESGHARRASLRDTR